MCVFGERTHSLPSHRPKCTIFDQKKQNKTVYISQAIEQLSTHGTSNVGLSLDTLVDINIYGREHEEGGKRGQLNGVINM